MYKVKNPSLQATSSLSRAIRIYADAHKAQTLIRRSGTAYDYATSHLLPAGTQPPLTPESVAAGLSLTTDTKWWVVVVGKETGVYSSETVVEYLYAHSDCSPAIHYHRPTRSEALAAYKHAYYNGYVFKI